jgi:hypothetical protein
MKLKILLGVVVLALLGGAFYWFQWRPSQIRIKCNDSAFKSSMDSFDQSSYTQNGRMDLKEKFYYDCLRYNGLEK